jgi:hypothetical protein
MVLDNQLEQAQKELEQDDNVIDFNSVKQARLAVGGKGPTDEPNWLKNLEVGSIFLAKERNPQMYPPWIGFQYAVEGITPGGNYFLLTKPNIESIVDPYVFSRIFKLMEVLMTSEEYNYLAALKKQDLEKEETEEKSYGDNTGTI